MNRAKPIVFIVSGILLAAALLIIIHLLPFHAPLPETMESMSIDQAQVEPKSILSSYEKQTDRSAQSVPTPVPPAEPVQPAASPVPEHPGPPWEKTNLASRSSPQANPEEATSTTSALGPEIPGHPVFGSAKLLQGLWSQQELRGRSGEAGLKNLPQPDLTPPGRLKPELTLPPLEPAMRQVIRSVRPEHREKVVALTFDLCERAVHILGYRSEIIDFLRTENIPATFFAGGKWMRSHQERTMQLMADPLFELGNHAWTHGNLGLMAPSEAEKQILWTQSQYELLRQTLAGRAAAGGLEAEMWQVPPAMILMRLPYGRCNQANLNLMAELGLPVVQWSGLADAGSPEIIASQIKPGDIILMHANGVPQNTHLILPRLVALLRQQGYSFVTVSELLRLGRPITVNEGYFSHPGDNLALDKKFLGQGTLGISR